MQDWKIFHKISKEVCVVASAATLIFSALEWLFPRSVASFINLGAWFVFWMFSVIIVILSNVYDRRSNN